MIKRTLLVFSILLFIWATAGCTLFRAAGGGSAEEQRKSKITKDELWDRAKALENEKAACQTRLADQQAQFQQTQKELSDQKEKIARTDQQVSALGKTVGDLSAKLTRPQETGAKAFPTPKETGLKRQALKIKVLAGDGKMASASGMSKKLRSIGYRVAKIDRAPRSDFKVHTVYYGPSRQQAALSLVKKLGRGTVARPLDWQSAFDLIVVTGHRA
jgi:uncharacterized protein (DUF3084 family)